MFDSGTDQELLLPSLSIRRFRGIERLDIPRLGRATLIAGKNGTGKTTVLDALRVFADRADVATLADILMRSEEIVTRIDEDEKFNEYFSFDALFFGRDPDLHAGLKIGPFEDYSNCSHVEILIGEEDAELGARSYPTGLAIDSHVLTISYGDTGGRFPALINRYEIERFSPSLRRRRARSKEFGDLVGTLRNYSLGPGVLSNRELDQMWGEIALTDMEPLAVQALQLACSSKIEAVAVVPGGRGSSDRRVVVKLEDGQRVSLRSLGDGATRLFGIAVALANAAGGFLLIDEVENGIHHSIQSELWSFLFQAASQHNVQIVATTHSWDSISGFAKAARHEGGGDAVVVRLEIEDRYHRSIEYAGEALEAAADHGIEVR